MNIVKKTVAGIMMLAIISVLGGQAYGSHADQSNRYEVNVPPTGSTYAIKVVGAAHIAGKDIIKLVSADMEFRVVSTKTDGVPLFVLEIISGNISVGDVIYELDKGVTTIRVSKVNLAASGNNGNTLVKIQATLRDHLPVSTSDDPAKLIPGQDRRSASIQVGAENLALDFHGTISRIA